MADYPENVMELRDQLRSEEDCRTYLVKLRWPDGVRCPDCEAKEVWLMRAPFYRCQHCGRDFTVTAGTLFADTHKPLRVWFEAIWHVTNQKSGVSALGLQRALGLGSYRTAWTWLHKLRRAMVRPGRDRLQGVVEVDETFIGGEVAGPRGRAALGKSLVLIAVQIDGRKVGRIRLQVYTLSGALSGFAGALLASRLGAGQPVAGTGWELDAIASVVVGGTLLSGGQGNAISTGCGVLLIGVALNVINLEGTISPYWQTVLRGAFLLAVVVVQNRVSAGGDRARGM
jgi:transposase-like protein